jgi:hypothetical protein
MRFLQNVPKKVLVSCGIIVGSLLLFILALLTLGQWQVDAAALQQRLTNEIAQTRKDLAQAQTDRQYLAEHQEQFEALLKGDRLVPHTRRVAILELQRLATANGLASLNYSFRPAGLNSPTAANAQPSTDAYRVSVEEIDLKVSAPIDGDIYRFIRDLTEAFPGSAVVQSIKLTRAAEITNAMLVLVSQGQDAQVVQGEINLSWRTAQAQEKPQAEGRSPK